MPSEDISSDRLQTDESLRAERDRADQGLAEKMVAIEEAADAVITRARQRADAVLAASRRKTDRAIDAQALSRRSRDVVQQDRRHEDTVVRQERAVADATLQGERDEHATLLAGEREATDNDLSCERQQADHAVETRDEFLAIVSHDLRNMLHSVVGFAALITEGLTAEPHLETLLGQARRIQRSGARMDRLVGDLVDVASIHAGALAVSREVGDPTAVLLEAVDDLHLRAMAAGMTVRVDVAQPLPQVSFDPARLVQVLINLLSNAVKFTGAQGTIQVRAERTGDDVRFSVSDTGIGIPADKLEAVFERYVQVDRNDRRGIGLGLYISKCIVNGHGGHIWAESREGEGSTFSFTLPIVPTAEAHPG